MHFVEKRVSVFSPSVEGQPCHYLEKKPSALVSFLFCNLVPSAFKKTSFSSHNAKICPSDEAVFSVD